MISLTSLSSSSSPTSMIELVSFLGQRAQPALIQYNEAERIELSGKVLINWFNKSVNLFSSHYGTLNEGCVLLMPPHWKSLFIALAIRAIGSELHWPADSIEAFRHTASFSDVALDTSVVFTHQDSSAVEELQDYPAEVVHVELASFAQEFSGEVDPFGLDFALEVPSQADQLLVSLEESELPSALSGNLLVLDQAGWDAVQKKATPHIAALFKSVPLQELFPAVLSHWAGGGSVSISDAHNVEAALRQENPTSIAVF